LLLKITDLASQADDRAGQCMLSFHCAPPESEMCRAAWSGACSMAWRGNSVRYSPTRMDLASSSSNSTCKGVTDSPG
jgi:hypothetical protein